jgi:hypothetical protein
MTLFSIAELCFIQSLNTVQGREAREEEEKTSIFHCAFVHCGENQIISA